MRGLFTAFIALSGTQILSVVAQADPACMTNCGVQGRADFTKFSCGNADDAPCLCAAPDFKNGVRDCATACGAAAGEAESFINDGFCVGQVAPAPTEGAPEPSSTAAQDAQPETSQPAETTQPAEPTQPAEEPQTTEQPAEESSTTEKPAEEPTSSEQAPEETSAVEETQPTSTTAQVQETTSAAAAETNTKTQTSETSETAAKPTSGADKDDSDKSDEDNKDDDEGKDEKTDEESGLSKGAIIGIAVGASAVGLAALGLMLFLCCRRRGNSNKKDARPFVEISKPMPMGGQGAHTGRTDPFQAEKGGNVMELQANRYEDMLPRQVPRTVV